MSSSNTNQIISKVWSFCDTLRDDGVGGCLNCDFYDEMNTMIQHPKKSQSIK